MPSTAPDSPTDPTPVPVGRLAPSPTGLLHLGHARTFLLAWWHLRARGGRVLLRLEDLDRTRVRPEFEDTILRDLEWLGLDWDGAPTRQSEHGERFLEAIRTLGAAGLTYPCVCTRREIRETQSAPHGPQESAYPGTCQDRFTSLTDAEAQTGRSAALRFRVSPGPVEFDDPVQGPQRFEPAREVGDFPITSRDGQTAYQLSVVVDDAAQGVTEVHRGADLLDSTAQQLLLQRGLGLPHPRWIHLPLVLDETGRRLAKRADDLSLARLRESGADPREVVVWAARSAGIGPGGLRTAAEGVGAFDLARVRPEGTRLGPEEVTRMFGEEGSSRGDEALDES